VCVKPDCQHRLSASVLPMGAQGTNSGGQ
jgi:hypothetical protein